MLLVRCLILFLAQHWLYDSFCSCETDDDHDNRPNKVDKQRLNVVVIGATGSLAEKHLWQGFYHFFQSKFQNYEIHFYGSGRTPADKVAMKFKTILRNSVGCNVSKCNRNQDQFLNRVKYVQLASSEHYINLCDELNRSENLISHRNDEVNKFCEKDAPCTERTTSSVEVGRVFYLAVPPFDYLYVAENINRHCRPPHIATWLRLAIEKPYGASYMDVVRFTQALGEMFTEEEIYRADHFLWKVGVRHILPFRWINKDVLNNVWSSDDIERIEIIMEEDEDCKGRINYYDKYGVVADVMQNHLTEVLLQIVAEPTENDNLFRKERMRVLDKLRPIQPEHAIHAQYDRYVDDARRETGNSTLTSSTATFAAAILSLKDPKWDGTSLLIVSGKALERKATYARVVFRDNVFCLPRASKTLRPLRRSRSGSHCSRRQIIFVINHNIGMTHHQRIHHPTILIHKNIPGVRCPPRWNLLASLNRGNDEDDGDAIDGGDDNVFLDVNLDNYNACVYDFRGTTEEEYNNAYGQLIKHLVQGRKSNFLGADHVLRTWKIWDKVIKAVVNDDHTEVRKYNSNEVGNLDVVHSREGLRFVN